MNRYALALALTIASLPSVALAKDFGDYITLEAHAPPQLLARFDDPEISRVCEQYRIAERNDELDKVAAQSGVQFVAMREEPQSLAYSTSVSKLPGDVREYIEAAKALVELAPLPSASMTSTVAMYRSPAQQLRDEADRIDKYDAAYKRFQEAAAQLEGAR